MKRVSLGFLFAFLWSSVVLAQPLPTSSTVLRITPSRCPTGVVPVVNANGVAGAPLALTTVTNILVGRASRQTYALLSDADLCVEYGGVTNNGPLTNPVGGGASTCTAGFLIKGNTLVWEDVFPSNRIDGACATGTCHVYTVECTP